MTEIADPRRNLLRTLERINLDINRQLDTVESEQQKSLQVDPPSIDRMSASGRCYRERWAAFRGLPLDKGKGFKAPLLRIFRLGHIIEDEVVDLLNSTPGYEVIDRQREVGTHPFLGHIDGILKWTSKARLAKTHHLLEIKSAKSARWNMLAELGYEAWNPGYAAQIQSYMHYIPEVSDAVIGVYNKDTSEIYWEQILQDKDVGEALVTHSLVATASGKPLPPPKPAPATSQYCKYCKYCDRSSWCWDPATDTRFDP